jgi:predicted RND superfamily exporter protein
MEEPETNKTENRGDVPVKSAFSFFRTLYVFFARRRVLLYVLTFAVIVIAALILRNITMNEDIAPLLPDGENEAARDFALLQRAPFADKVLISLKAGQGASKQSLVDTADRLTKAMTHPYFIGAVSGPEISSFEAIPQWLMNALPNTFTAKDQLVLEGMLTPEAVQDRLKKSYKQLTSQEGT